jgi:hypothetical protein
MASASQPRISRGRWVAAWLIFLLVAGAAVAGAYLPKERFEATSVVSVQPAGEGVSTQLLSYLIPIIEARVSGTSMAAAVDQTLPVTVRDPNRVVSTSVPEGAGVMSITVTSENPATPIPTANAYAQYLATQDLGTPALQVLVIDSATEATVTTPRLIILLSGLALGIVLASLVALTGAGSGRRSEFASDYDVPAGAGLPALPRRAEVGAAPRSFEVR